MLILRPGLGTYTLDERHLLQILERLFELRILFQTRVHLERLFPHATDSSFLASRKNQQLLIAKSCQHLLLSLFVCCLAFDQDLATRLVFKQGDRRRAKQVVKRRFELCGAEAIGSQLLVDNGIVDALLTRQSEHEVAALLEPVGLIEL